MDRSTSISKLLLPVAYLPPVHYFGMMMKAGEVWVEQHETYPKQTYRNRCEIYTANGKLPLSIPVNKIHGNHTRTRDVLLSDHENWQALHWRAIRSAYANSPFFLYYHDSLEPFFNKPYHRLLDFNLALMQVLMDLLGIGKKIHLTRSFDPAPENMLDLREALHPKKTFHHFTFRPYHQTFGEKHGFIQGLSMIDLLFNAGPDSIDIISD